MKNSFSPQKQFSDSYPSSPNENIFSSTEVHEHTIIQICGVYIFILKTALFSNINPVSIIILAQNIMGKISHPHDSVKNDEKL